jgi:hypothetical protein
MTKLQLFCSLLICSLFLTQCDPKTTPATPLQNMDEELPNITNNTFDQLIDNTLKYLDIYSEIYPDMTGEDRYAYSNIGFSTTTLDSIRKDSSEYEYYSQDSIDAFSLIYILQNKIMSSLKAVTQHPQFKQTKDITQRLKADNLAIAHSPDYKLFNFSIDEKTGGTYRSRLSLSYYTDATPDTDYTNLEGDGFDKIDTIHTQNGQIHYLLHSYVRTCSYCFDMGIAKVYFQNDAFEDDFVYGLSIRNFETGKITYDSKSHQIIADYETDDLTPTCACLATKRTDEIPEMGTKCRCVFEFDGRTFVLKE